jgi:pimeloyl-ACP methyl ester carboxylesterase
MRFDLFAMSDAVARWCDAVGIERAHFVGNSLGGAISSWIAIDRPTLVRSLALVSPAGLVMPVASPLQRLLDAGENPWVFDSYDGYDALMRLVLERPPTLPPALRRFIARRYFARAEQNARLLDELLADDVDLTPRLHEIEAPTLVVWGSEDRVIDLSAGRLFHERIAGSRLVVLHGVGHCPQYEVPERLGPMLAGFLAQRRG